MKTVVPADIINGKLHIGHAWRLALQDGVLTWPDGPVTVSIERQHATRSAQANAYYWGVVIRAMSEYTGSTPDEMHDVLKLKFLPKDLALASDNGEVIAEFVIGGSTAQLNVVQFYDYVEQIRQWAFEFLDVDMPPPDPEWRARVAAERAKLAAPGPPREPAGVVHVAGRSREG